MKKIIYILSFLGNIIIFLIFGLDMLNYYSISNINIINNDINRPFIVWCGFIISLYNMIYFIHKYEES